MSWLRRIFGGSGDGDDRGRGKAPEPSAHKAELLERLRERGARSALVTYDGGNDEGGVSSLAISTEPLGAPADSWTGTALPGGQEVLWGDWSEEGASLYGNRPDADERLLSAAEEVVCEKWGGFAGEFQVEGRLVIDVDADRVVRQDISWITEEDDDEDAERFHETEVV